MHTETTEGDQAYRGRGGFDFGQQQHYCVHPEDLKQNPKEITVTYELGKFK